MSDELSNFLYPRSRYNGQMQPENLIFNANLQEFSLRVSYICGLHANGKLSTQEAYQAVKTLWKQLEHTELQLGINTRSRE